MNKRVMLTLLAAATAAAMIAGCAPAAHPDNANAANAALSSASQPENKPQAASPYSQPLMATGGDLVMRGVTTRGIAG